MNSPVKVVSGVIFCIGLAAFGVLAWVLSKGPALDRALDAGDIVVMGVFGVFGSFCLLMAWHLFRSPSTVEDSAGVDPAAGPAGQRPVVPPSKRTAASSLCSTAGVFLLVLAAVLPDRWYPVVPLFVGIALLAVSHALTPCEERLDKLRKMRASVRQL